MSRPILIIYIFLFSGKLHAQGLDTAFMMIDIATQFATATQAAGTIDTCNFGDLLNTDYFTKNQSLICDGLPCAEDDFDCIRIERGKKYDQFCSNMINPEYLDKMHEQKDLTRRALASALKLEQLIPIEQSINYINNTIENIDGDQDIEAFTGLNEKGLFDEEGYLENLKDKKNQQIFFAQIIRNENESYSDGDIEEAKDCLQKVTYPHPIINPYDNLENWCPLQDSLLASNRPFQRNVRDNLVDQKEREKDEKRREAERNMYVELSTLQLNRNFALNNLSFSRTNTDEKRAKIEQQYLEEEERIRGEYEQTVENLNEEFNIYKDSGVEEEQDVINAKQDYEEEVIAWEKEKVQARKECRVEEIKNILCSHPKLNIHAEEFKKSSVLSSCKEASPTASKKCLSQYLVHIYENNKRNATRQLDSEVPCSIPSLCTEEEQQSQKKGVDSIYSKERMEKLQAKFDKMKRGYNSLFFKWKEEGIITPEQQRLYRDRINKIALKKPRDLNHVHELNGAAGVCECKIDTSVDPEDACEHNQIFLSKDFMNTLETPLADIEINNLFAHEIAHAIAPPFAGVEFSSFDDQYSCLSKSLRPDNYDVEDYDKIYFRGEAMADFLSIEVNVHMEQKDPLDETNVPILESSLSWICNTGQYNQIQGNECYQDDDGIYLYPAESKNIGCNNLDTLHQIGPDRLAIILENKSFRDQFNCPAPKGNQLATFPTNCANASIEGEQ